MFKGSEQVILGAIEAIRVLAPHDEPAALLRKILPYLSEEEALYWVQWYGLR